MTPTLHDLADRLALSEARAQRAERRARLSGLTAAVALSAACLLNLRPVAFAQAPGVSLASLVARITALEAKTAPLTIGNGVGQNTELTIKGVNVHIVSGSGTTNDGGNLTGLGNLIIGYNAGLQTTGSHNLILGDNNNYTSYGGIVAGQQNTISSEYASVTGGSRNQASGNYTAISGGVSNKATADYAAVSGGGSNTASATDAAVSGGVSNTASDSYASVSGGSDNDASAMYTSISGGYNNQAISDYDSVSGGYQNVASGGGSSVSGGKNVTQAVQYGWSAGSEGNILDANGNFSSP